MEGFESLTDDQIQQLLELGILQDEQGQLDRQMSQAEAIRGMAMPEMRGNGRVMVAANPLEFLGQGVMKYGAKRDMDKISARRGEIGNKQVAARRALLEALRGTSENPYTGTRINDPGIDLSGFA